MKFPLGLSCQFLVREINAILLQLIYMDIFYVRVLNSCGQGRIKFIFQCL
jgi:hypothetical protein